MKGVQCYELFGGIALKIRTFSFFQLIVVLKSEYLCHLEVNVCFSHTSVEVIIAYFGHYLHDKRNMHKINLQNHNYISIK